MDVKLNSKTHLGKDVFGFLSCFVRFGLKFAKSANMTTKIFFLNTFNMGDKKTQNLIPIPIAQQFTRRKFKG